MPIIGELELGWRALEAETIAITGTNGKTTTTALTGALLAEQPRPVLVAGNIGTPLAARALGFPPDGLVVCEVSSFQLETTDAFQPRVAAVLNITPDHLDRHGSLAAYVDAKARIFANQTPADCTIVNADDEAAEALARRTRARVVWFSRRRPASHGVFVRDGWVAATLNGHVEAICPVAEIFLRGAHNVENVLAAAACALWAGLAPEAIRRAIGRFRAVAHRIEFVRDRRGALPSARGRRGGGGPAGHAWGRGAALAGVRLVRHVRQLRAPGRRVQEARGAARVSAPVRVGGPACSSAGFTRATDPGGRFRKGGEAPLRVTRVSVPVRVGGPAIRAAAVP